MPPKEIFIALIFSPIHFFRLMMLDTLTFWQIMRRASKALLSGFGSF
jgi:hypothetical protein